jgi:hypothetical protein
MDSRIADKASRTVAMLTERLDQHRGRGHQQIVVKHVTVNADQAMVADSMNDAVSAAKLVPATVDQPMPNIGPSQKESVPVEGGLGSTNEHQPQAKHTKGCASLSA